MDFIRKPCEPLRLLESCWLQRLFETLRPFEWIFALQAIRAPVPPRGVGCALETLRAPVPRGIVFALEAIRPPLFLGVASPLAAI